MTPAATPIISWLAKYTTYLQKPLVIAIVIATVTAVIGGLLLTIRYSRTTGFMLRALGIFFVACGGALAYGKFRIPASKVPTAWVWVPVIGIVLLVAAWFLRRLRIRAVRGRIKGLTTATEEYIEALIKKHRAIDFVDLMTSDGWSVIPFLRSFVRRSKSGRCIALTGLPGSGKTATLLNFAADCQQWRSARNRPLIAMYVDLADYAARTKKGLLANFIQSEFTDLNGNTTWTENGRDVRWIFLFDNADEADLRWRGQEQSWQQVTDFVRQRSDVAPFYAVVATSMQPKNVYPNDVIKLEGLTDDGWQKLLTGVGVDQAAMDELAKDKSLHWYLTDPYTVRLLAPVLARRASTNSDNVHKLMGDAIDHRLQRLPHSPAMNPQSLRATATATIKFLQARPGFTPEVPGEISEGIAHIAEATGSSVQEIDDNLTALAKCGIVKRTRNLENTEYVEFGPAIGAYFYTCALLESPDTISVRTLLCSRPFRLTAISLLKVCDSEIIERFVRDAGQLLDWAIDGLPTESTPPDTKPDQNQVAQMAYFPYAALSVLVEGLQNRLEVLDEQLREKTIEFTERAMPHENPGTQADLLELSYALGTREQAISTMKFGLDSPDSDVVFDTARRMVNAISESEVTELDEVRRDKLISVVIMVGLRSLTPNQGSNSTPSALRLADGAGAAAIILYGILFGLAGVAQLINFRHYRSPGSSYPFLQICEILAAVLVAGSIVAARYNRSWRRFVLQHDFESAMLGVSYLLAAVGASWGVFAVVSDLATFTISLMPLLMCYSLIWPICVLVYLLSDRPPTITNLIFPLPRAISVFWHAMF